MSATFTRRSVLSSALAITLSQVSKAGAEPSPSDIAARLADIEAAAQGRLGVTILDTKTGKRYGRREDERFPLLSTFKFLAAGLVLSRVDAGKELFDRRVRYAKQDLVQYSPATERHLDEGMTVAEICAAAITLSDNTAGNLMLASFGGPVALTAYARALGDTVTRLDRIEPDLNNVPSGEMRDTTTPAAMLGLMHKLLMGDALSLASRQQLIAWLVDNQTGGKRLRAGLPRDWRVGDKTGSAGSNGNDIAIAWPPGRDPLLIASYYVGIPNASEQRDLVHAGVGHIIAGAL
ncbi:MAG: class A beta-lactamase [Hyphomicrobium sp.]|jgi:beta-lactamase class A